MKFWPTLAWAVLLLPMMALAAADVRLPVSSNLNGWRFSNGPEFPGAAGRIEYQTGSVQLHGDFRGGGDYVAVFHPVDDSVKFNVLKFKIKTRAHQVAVRFRDSEGQVHQHFQALGYAGKDWEEIAVPVEGSSRSRWGGAANGVLRGAVKEIGIVIHRTDSPELEDDTLIRDVRLAYEKPVPAEEPLELAKFDPAKVTVNGEAKITKEGDALIIEIAGPQKFHWPGVNLRPQNGSRYFDLSRGTVLAMEVTNLGAHQIELRAQIENTGANGQEFCVKGGMAFDPGETATFRIRYYRNGIAPDDVRFEAVINPFEGLRGANNLEVAKVTNLMLFDLDPRRPIKVAVRNIRVEEPFRGVSDAVKSAGGFYPAIDKFGQYKHKDWPGKAQNDEDLKRDREAEQADLAAHPAIPGRTIYGGWADGPDFEATGNFYPVKYQEKWYLVDPSGKLFFSLGIDQFSASETTGITLREHYFEGLEPKDGELGKSLWGRGGFAPNRNFYHSKNTRPETYNFLGRNLAHKYGPDWRKQYVDLLNQRAVSWGVNTLANWSWQEFARAGRVPYVIQVYSDAPVVRGHQGVWEHFEDVFDPKFEESIERFLKDRWQFALNDPMCIGAFVDNEHAWGGETGLAEAVVRSPADQIAKLELRKRLEAKYGTVEKLNTAWHSRYASWDDFLQQVELPDLKAADADLRAFNQEMVERYFEGARNGVKRAMSGKLYLGCRFAGKPREELIRVAAKFTDVLSFNIYHYSVADFQLPEGVDCPVMIGEFHFGTIAEGHSHPGLAATADHQDRARAYQRYVDGVLRHPNFVGCHYYRLFDEAPAGRGMDNENMGVGFVSITDRPYPEMVNAIREVSTGMYQRRAAD